MPAPPEESVVAIVSTAGSLVAAGLRPVYRGFSSPRMAVQSSTRRRVACSGSVAPAMADTTNQPSAFVLASMGMSSAFTPPPTMSGYLLIVRISSMEETFSVVISPFSSTIMLSGFVAVMCSGPAPM